MAHIKAEPKGRPLDPMLGQTVAGYRVVREIGRGGMGVVYEAVNDIFGQRAALKCLSASQIENPEAISRFIDEARAASAVPHPGLVKIFNCDRLPSGVPYILMEFLSGESLRDRQDRLHRAGARLPLPDALRITRDIASALDAVHRHKNGIVHRDLKPGNVMLVPAPPDQPATGETIRVVDFGIAKITQGQEGEDAAARKTTEGKFLGTAIYASPEQCKMEGRVGAASDVYSLGVMLYEMVAARPPFDGATGLVMGLHMMAAPPPLRQAAPTVPDAVHDLVHRMLAKQPADRPSMNEVVSQIEHIQLGGARWVWWLKRRGRRIALGACAALLLVVAAGVRFLHASPPVPPVQPTRILATPPVTAPQPAVVPEAKPDMGQQSVPDPRPAKVKSGARHSPPKKRKDKNDTNKATKLW